MPPPWHHQGPDAFVRKLCVGRYENNVYVVACTATRKAVIIDAAAEPERIAAASSDVEPVAILTTHGHFDHMGAARATAERFGIPFRLHPADADRSGVEPDEPIEEGALTVGDLTIEVVHTPGHTPGSVTFLTPGVAFTGDTLFPGGPGATRGPGSSFDQIIAGIESRLFALPGDTLVMPGHGLDTTAAAETPSLDEWKRRGW